MKKVNTNDIEPLTWSSPKGTMGGAGIQISEALGRKRDSTDLLERHPFDVEILRIPAGKAPYPYHSHSAQWEFYHVISGSGNKWGVQLPQRRMMRSEALDYFDGEE